MKGTFPIDKFQEIQTPFYYYDTNVLRQTLKTINEEAGKHEGFEVHYAVKANANPKVLNIICQAGLGADCVSGGEIQAAIKAGFPASLRWSRQKRLGNQPRIGERHLLLQCRKHSGVGNHQRAGRKTE